VTERLHGELAFWKDLDGKRFGFLRPSGSGNDVYVAGAGMDRAGVESPRVGEHFSFEVMQDRRGDRATDIRREGGAAAAERAFKHELVRP
jgi:cold shock CspA family protein